MEDKDKAKRNQKVMKICVSDFGKEGAWLCRPGVKPVEHMVLRQITSLSQTNGQNDHPKTPAYKQTRTHLLILNLASQLFRAHRPLNQQFQGCTAGKSTAREELSTPCTYTCPLGTECPSLSPALPPKHNAANSSRRSLSRAYNTSLEQHIAWSPTRFVGRKQPRHSHVSASSSAMSTRERAESSHPWSEIVG